MADKKDGRCVELCCADGKKRMVCNENGKLNVKELGDC